MPVLPFISDGPEPLDESVKKIKEAGAGYIVFSGLTLKPGRQMDYYMEVIREKFPGLAKKYQKISTNDTWGNLLPAYYQWISGNFLSACQKHQIPFRVPVHWFSKSMEENDKIALILEQLHYMLGQAGQKSPYRKAAYALHYLPQPVSSYLSMEGINGLEARSIALVQEIIRTGRCKPYEELLFHGQPRVP
jgi:hypothetical protein